MAPLLATLAAGGLDLLVSAIKSKGKEVVERQLGISLPEGREFSEKELVELKSLEFQHQEWLLENALESKKAELAADANEQDNVTKRWEADSASDDPEARKIRPRTLKYLLAVMTLAMIGDGAGYKVDEMWVQLLQALLLTVFAAYFGGRTLEKVVALLSQWRKK